MGGQIDAAKGVLEHVQGSPAHAEQPGLWCHLHSAGCRACRMPRAPGSHTWEQRGASGNSALATKSTPSVLAAPSGSRKDLIADALVMGRKANGCKAPARNKTQRVPDRNRS